MKRTSEEIKWELGDLTPGALESVCVQTSQDGIRECESNRLPLYTDYDLQFRNKTFVCFESAKPIGYEQRRLTFWSTEVYTPGTAQIEGSRSCDDCTSL